MISLEKLQKLLSYDPATGLFKWLPRPRMRAGKTAGSQMEKGYIRIYVDGRSYQENILAWFYMTGEWPVADVDHRDGNRANNRYLNLRDVSRSVNLENMRKAKSNSTTGFLGVKRCRDRFQAGIMVRGKRMHLGTYRTPELAHAAYLTAKREFHEGCTI